MDETAALFKGIDVSVHNGGIHWPAVKTAGKQFVMIRAGLGNGAIDKNFEANIKGALNAGLHVGAYWFSYAYTAELALKEAGYFAAAMKPYKGKAAFPLCFDWESDSERYAKSKGVTPTKPLVVNMAISFLKGLEAEGWYAMNYQNLDFTKIYFDDPKMRDYDIWLANYQDVPAIACGLHQTTDGGTIPEANPDCKFDFNASYKDYPRIIKDKHLNGF